ncbi:hypothetical protein ABZZ74_48870 [Streptomyces sp. NPDC006476]|uniref:hypothetical protein n=1 Tax=Streptomyces sp. NPDC006476 TaxID=3157175 RepID=UPI0033AD6F9B
MTPPRRQTYGRLPLFAPLPLGIVIASEPVMSTGPSFITSPSLSSGPSAMAGTDPASVCLASLSPFTLLLLPAAGLVSAAHIGPHTGRFALPA